MKAKVSLTKEQYDLLYAAYEYFNKRLFDSKLPDVMIVLHRKKNSYGYFHAERFADKTAAKKERKSFDELSLNPDDFTRTDTAILSTLVHEMVHVWQHHLAEKKSKGAYHDKIWAAKMKEVGLFPSSTGREGGKETGQRVSHYIIQDGRYEKAALKFLANKKIKLSSFPIFAASAAKKNKTAYQCSCGTKIWGKPNLSVACNECGDDFAEI